MFGRNFYNQLHKKYIVIFGNMFNNISFVRRNTDTGIELERMTVPIMYAPKEKYITRLASDPTLQRETQITLPRMSYEMVSRTYDPPRAQNRLLRNAKVNTRTASSSQYMGVPYDMTFELNIYTKNIDDGYQIIEQILPYFSPDYTVTANLIPEIGLEVDIPITLNSITDNISHETNYDSVRYCQWTLTFSMKGYFYGPVANTSIIRKIDVNIWNDPSLQAGHIVKFNVGDGTGNFKLEELVYQGDNQHTATAYGIVVSWSNLTNKLIIGGTQGTFLANTTIKSVSGNASYNIASFDAAPLKLANIHIEPSPNTANPGDVFSYDTTITEWPETSD